MNSIDLVIKERKRQVEQLGYSPEHDDKYVENQLAFAAATYGLRPNIPLSLKNQQTGVPLLWPWDDKHWKPSPDDRVRELVISSALTLAEIDRIIRLKNSK